MEEKLAALETENKNLKTQITHLKQVIHDTIEKDVEQILDFFNCCRSIRKTALKYSMTIEELYEHIPMWSNSYESLHKADDFEECRIIVIGRRTCDAELYEEMDDDELAIKTRELSTNDITNIINYYKNSELSLYELADKYELKIEYLFKILKDNGIIEKETDAKGYAVFYREYCGAKETWDGKSDMGFLDQH